MPAVSSAASVLEGGRSLKKAPDKLRAEWFWVDRWDASSAALLTMEQQGVYRTMLSQAWLRGARLPNDEQAIQRAIRCSREEWERSWPAVRGYWRVDGEWLVNDTQLEVYLKTKRELEVKHEKAMKAAAAAPQVRRKRDREVDLKVEPMQTPKEKDLEKETDTSPEGNGAAPDHRQAMLDYQRSEYAEAVWQEFCARVGQPTRTMSRVEFEVVDGWLQRGIPLRIVLRGIQDTKGNGRTLAYFGPSVLEAFDHWRQAVGA